MSVIIKGHKLSPSQEGVYRILADHGPLADHVLVPVAQHVLPTHPASSGVRTRRKELERMGLVEDTGEAVETASGRAAAIFKAVV